MADEVSREPAAASPTASTNADRFSTDPPRRAGREPDALPVRIAMSLASLKLTVILFAMALFIVFAGTLGQVDKDINEVISHYFRMPAHFSAYVSSPTAWFHAAFAKIDLKIFLPHSFFPNAPETEAFFYFPKGWLIGLGMFVNLAAAHALRFRIQATGTRLLSGLIVLGIGMLVTFAVIQSGSMANDAGVQGEAIFSWSTIWLWIKLALASLWFVLAYSAATLDASRKGMRIFLATLAAVFGGALLALFIYNDSLALGDSAMRILWQLIKATVAGLVLLGGCILLFKQRAGIVLLHGGVGLMMLSELLVGTQAVETKLTAQEGQWKNYVEDMRSVEVAVVDPSDPKQNIVIAVPFSRIEDGETLTDDALPFDIKLREYIPHAEQMRAVKAGEENPATVGIGLTQMPVPKRRSTALEQDAKFDIPSAYVEFSDKVSGKSLGVYLLSVLDTFTWVEADQRPEHITVGNRTYDVALRYQRHYLNYWVEVIDAAQELYEGTSTPRSYSSQLRLHGEDGAELLQRKVWMNNPLRYAGVTMYQSDFGTTPAGVEFTGLQVVTNVGWMIPYVSCMIVVVGMFYQFGGTLLRFVRGRAFNARQFAWRLVGHFTMGGPATAVAARAVDATHKKRDRSLQPPTPAWQTKLGFWLPIAAVAIAALWVAQTARPKTVKPSEMDLEAFGRLPVMDQGRAKPFDTLARTTMRIVAKRQTFKDADGQTQPAIRWLLDLMTLRAADKGATKDDAGAGRNLAVDNDAVYCIESLEIKQLLNLPMRKNHMYALREFGDKLEKLEAEAQRIEADLNAKQAARIAAGKTPEKNATSYERQVLELYANLRTIRGVELAFQHPNFARLRARLAELKSGDNQQINAELAQTLQDALEAVKHAREIHNTIAEMTAKPPQPFQVTDKQGKTDWDTFAHARAEQFIHDAFPAEVAAQAAQMRPSEETRALDAIFASYRADDATGFNQAVREYRELLATSAPEQFTHAYLNFEAFFNRFDPFYLCAVLYMFAFIIAAAGLLGLEGPLNRTAFSLIAFTFLLHNFALLARIFISGRPPITNLYTTAVFIGWACVLFGLVFEGIFRLGFGNIIAGWTGFCTLLIADFLSYDSGDTFTVLQAVLDTQFWLATHVVSINIGYASTFLAGFFGVLYVLLGVCTPGLNRDKAKTLARMTYGTLCFAMFFSFFGTVLGGLWADDSWGRFWGWDNKENGALMIVLWNALVLHARWGGMVKDRGLAMLCIGGNIVTAWSYFGTNELGVGLHAYGKIEGVATTLLFFWATQLGIIALGCLPKEIWWSNRRQQPLEAEIVA